MKRRTCQNGGKSFAIEKISEQYSMKFGFLVKHTPKDLGIREETKFLDTYKYIVSSNFQESMKTY